MRLIQGFVLALLSAVAAGAVISAGTPPGLRGKPVYIGNTLSPDRSPTNASEIASAVRSVHQKSGSSGTTRPKKAALNMLAAADPATPNGYELVFGPIDAANNAPGYMGFAFLDSYDVGACAQLCNTRSPDPVGGACLYFNIWRALVNGVPTTYTCSMYYFPTDDSTANNYGQGNLNVTLSRGYRRLSYVVDGGFEGYFACVEFCYTESYMNWFGTSPPNGVQDATIFSYHPYAHFGQGVGLLGSAVDADDFAGTLSPQNTLYTVPGQVYQLAFFHSSTFSGASFEVDAFVDIMWNGEVVDTIRPGYQEWTFYSFNVTAVGNDVLAFHGGRAPAWLFIDDVFLFKI